MKLETESRSEAPLPRLIRSVKSRDKAEVTAVGVTGGIREVRMVRSVQRFCPQLELHLLGDRERSEDTQVRLEESCTTQTISTHSSEACARFVRPGAV